MPRRIRGRRLNANDFRRLGLDVTEARVAVIRRAALQAASSLVAQEDQASSPKTEAELARLVSSVYRLLDPRRREQLAERVQLLHTESAPVHAAIWWNQTDSPTGGAETGNADARDPNQNSDSSESEDDDADEVLMMLADLRIEVPPRQGSVLRARSLSRLQRVGSVVGSLRTWFTRLNGWQRTIAGLCTTTTATMLLVFLIPLGWPNSESTSVLGGTQATGASVEPAVTPNERQPSPAAGAVALGAGMGSSAAADAIGKGDPETVSSGSPSAPSGAGREEVPNAFPATAAEGGDDATLGEPPIAKAEKPAATTDAAAKGQPNELPMDDLLTEDLAGSELTTAEPAPLDAAVAVRFPVPTEDSFTTARRRIKALLPQRRSAPGSDGASQATDLRRRAAGAEAGSADRYALLVEAATRLVLRGEFADATAIVGQLCEEFDDAAAPFSLVILKQVEDEAATLTERERAAQWALRVSEVGLQDEHYDVASEAARLGTAVAAAVGDSGLRGRYRQQREAVAMAELLAPTASRTLASHSAQTADATAASQVARHLCIHLRRWEQGIGWMAAGADARLAAIAREELELADEATPEQLATLARRWVDAAGRQRGRTSESLLLHARELLSTAESQATGLARIEIQQQIEKLDEMLPDDLAPLLATTAAPAPDEGSATLGALGRLSLGGQDLGVVMRHRTDLPLPRSAIDQILDQLDRPHGEVQMEFHAAFVLEQSTTVVIGAAGPSDATGKMALAIDRVPIELQPGTAAATVDLPAGLHRVLWQVSGGQFEPCRLTVRNDRDGSLVHLRHDAATRAITEQLPVKVRVGFAIR